MFAAGFLTPPTTSLPSSSLLLQLFQEVGRLEIFRHRIIQPRDDLVNRLLPRLLGVLPALYRAEELSQRLLNDVSEILGHLDMIIPIVVQVENAVDFAVVAHVDVVHVLHAFADRLAGVLLHLNVVEFPEVGEPLDQLGGVVLVELDVREVHLEDGRAGVPHPEEHQLRLAQVHRGQC